MSARKGVRRWARTALLTPTAAVALVALSHGVFWSLVIPPFQAPDETDHFAYAQYLGETGNLPPVTARPPYSSEQRATFAAIGTLSIIGRPLGKPPGTASAARRAKAAVEVTARLPRSDGGGPSSATSQPPLFYALATVPYLLGSNDSILTRLWLMRLLSVLCFVATATGAALLGRDLLPSRPWAPAVAGLVVALQPALAFSSSVVNPDALLFATSTFALLIAARIVRRGLTTRRAVSLGALVGLGLVTKVTFAGLVPGLAFALAIGSYRAAGSRPRREVLRIGGCSVAAAVALPLLYVIWTLLDGRGLLPKGGGVAPLPNDRQASASLRALVSYSLQLFLPRFGLLQDQFGFWPPYTTWLVGFVGHLGWLDYGVRDWIYHVAAGVFCASLVLLVIALLRGRHLQERRWELAAFGVCTVGLTAEIAAAGYDYHRKTGLVFEQARYLFPLVALYGAGIATACTAFGRRVAPVLAACYVGLASLHVLAIVFASVARYYA